MGHTPGPWTLGGKETTLFGSGAYVVFSRNKHIVAAANPHACTSGDDADKANARLIAAAPELLDVLKLIAQENLADETMRRVVQETARAAIAKAEGRA